MKCRRVIAVGWCGPKRDETGWYQSRGLLILLLAMGMLFSPLVWRPDEVLVGQHRDGQNDLLAYAALRLPPVQHVLQHGVLPFWQEEMLCGEPILGSPQTAYWYPANWLLLVWPQPAMLGWLLVLHHLWLGWGTTWLARRLGLRLGADVLAGVFAAGAPFFLVQTAEGHLTQVAVTSWIPWILLAWLRFLRHPTSRWPVLSLAIALSLLAGHIQEIFYLCVLLAGWGITVVIQVGMRHQPERLRGLILGGALAALAAIGLAAIDLLPVFDYARHSVRTEGLSTAEASLGSLGLPSLVQLVAPFWWGGPDDYRGPGRFYWETLCYFGVTPLFLTLVGLCAGGRRRHWRVFVLLWVLSASFAFGQGNPIYEFCQRCLPGFSLFRVPGRSLFLVSILGALLAGLGAQTILRCFRSLPRTAPRTAMALLLVAGLVELTWFAQQVLATVPSTAIVRNEHPVIDWLREHPSDGRVLVPQEFLNDAEARLKGVRKLQGYDPVPLLAHARLFAALTETAPEEALLGFNPLDADQLNETVLSFAGVEWLITPPRKQPIRSTAWSRVAQLSLPRLTGRDHHQRLARVEIYQFANPLPAAYVIGSAKLYDPTSRIEDQLRHLKPREEVLLTQDLLPAGVRAHFTPIPRESSRPGHVSLQATLDAPGYLILRDTYLPGWHARVNGVATPVLLANGSFQAIPLLAGNHRVELRYRPRGFQTGALLAGLSLAIILGKCLSDRVQRSTAG